MSKRRKVEPLQRLTRTHIRPNEGVVIPVFRSPDEGGQTYGADLSQAPVPDRRYSADVAAVLIGDDLVRLQFGQLTPSGSGLASILVIKVSFSGVRNFLKSMASVVTVLEPLLNRLGVAKQDATALKGTAEQAVTVDANIIAAGFAGRDACMDYYYASAFAVAAIPHTSNLHIDPVVRITLASSLMLAVYERLDAAKDRIPEE
jgi:hypothetical protein